MGKEDMIFQRLEDTPWNAIEDEAVVLNLDNGHYYVLNETGRIIWEMLDGKHTLSQIADHLCEQFEVERDEALADIYKLTDDLVKEGLISA